MYLLIYFLLTDHIIESLKIELEGTVKGHLEHPPALRQDQLCCTI